MRQLQGVLGLSNYAMLSLDQSSFDLSLFKGNEANIVLALANDSQLGVDLGAGAVWISNRNRTTSDPVGVRLGNDSIGIYADTSESGSQFIQELRASPAP